MWYLSEDLVVLALADSGYNRDMRARLAAILLATAQCGDIWPFIGKMKVHLLRNKLSDGPHLYLFVRECSWLMFELFHIGSACPAMHCWVSETLPFPKTITAPNMSGGKYINSSQITDFSGSMLYPNDLNLS